MSRSISLFHFDGQDANGKQHSTFSVRSCQLSVQTQPVAAGKYTVQEMTDVGSKINNKSC